MTDLTPTDAQLLAERLEALDRSERLWAHELTAAIERSDDLARQLEAQRRTHEHEQARLTNEFEQSLSWRVTAPLRKARRLFRQLVN